MARRFTLDDFEILVGKEIRQLQWNTIFPSPRGNSRELLTSGEALVISYVIESLKKNRIVVTSVMDKGNLFIRVSGVTQNLLGNVFHYVGEQKYMRQTSRIVLGFRELGSQVFQVD